MISAKEAKELATKKKELKMEKLRAVAEDILTEIDRGVKSAIELGHNNCSFVYGKRADLTLYDYDLLNDIIVKNLQLLGYQVINNKGSGINKQFILRW